MGELASESQGSKELGKTLAWEEDLETPLELLDIPRLVWSAGCWNEDQALSVK